MAKTSKNSEETRGRILRGAGRGFRSHGYGGVGVDALAREAGVTSGAFYGHFDSKSEAFREALTAGLEDLRAGIETVRRDAGAKWQERFTDFYLGERRTCDLADSCALQSLSVDAARADDDAARRLRSRVDPHSRRRGRWFSERHICAPETRARDCPPRASCGRRLHRARGAKTGISEGIAKAVRKLALEIRSRAHHAALDSRVDRASCDGSSQEVI